MKRFVTGAVTATMVAVAITPVAANTVSFTDVPKTDSHYANILGAVDRGLMKGYADGTFKPAQDISRSQVVKVLANHVVNKENLSYKEYIAKYNLKSTVKAFTDVPASSPDAELFEASLIVKHTDIFTGSNNYLMPLKSITRQQMAKVLVNAFELKDLPGDLSIVKDNGKAQAEFVPYINILSENGVTVVEDFRPTETVKRSQIASFLIRAYDISAEVPEDTLLVTDGNVTVDRVNGHNVITVDYGHEMTNTATDLANYKIENRALTDNFFAGAQAEFTDATKKVVKITLPSGKYAVEDEFKTIEFSKNIKTVDDLTVQTATKTEVKVYKKFKDDTGSLLNKAEFVVASADSTTSNVVKLTFNENTKINAGDIDKDITVQVGATKVTGTVTDGKYTDAANNDVLLVVLKDNVNTAQAGTVSVVAEGVDNPVMGITDLYGNKATAKSVTLKDKVVDKGITDAVGTPDEEEKEEEVQKPVIDLGLGNGGLIGGGISLDSLLNNSGLLRLNLPLGSGLAIGDILNLGSGSTKLLGITLTEADFDRGYVSLNVDTTLLQNLLGQGGLVDLTATIDRDGGIISSAVYPVFSIVKPVLDTLVGVTDGDLALILSGKKDLKVNIEATGLEQIKAGDKLTLKVQGQGAKTETIEHIVSESDIQQGYVNYRFNDPNLLGRVLKGLTGNKITITPSLTHEGVTVDGNAETITVSKGLLERVNNLLGGLLGGILGGLGGILGGIFGK